MKNMADNINFYGGTVSATITQRKPMFVKGQLVRIAKKKRVWGQVKDDSIHANGETKVTLNSVYRPAPKSKLLNKSVFSKVKSKIIPLTKSNNQ